MSLKSRLGRKLSFGTAGGVTVELALVTPVLIALILGGVDFGLLLNNAQSVAAATRVGAEFARTSAVCKSSATGIYADLATETMGIHSGTGQCLPLIQDATQSARPLGAPLTVNATLNCRCADDTVLANCFDTCPEISRPKSVYITVSASQAPIAPFLPWPGFPANPLTASASLQIQ
jgi:Flp pilus assembly protein TadG